MEDVLFLGEEGKVRGGGRQRNAHSAISSVASDITGVPARSFLICLIISIDYPS